MAVYSPRQMDGNGRGTPTSPRPKKPSRQELLRSLRRYADLVIAPRQTRHFKPGQNLNAQRLKAAQEVIQCAVARGCLKLPFDIAEMARTAERGLPFAFTALDAWRIAVDQLHTMNAGRRQWVAV